MRDVNDLPHVDLREPDSAARVITGLMTHGVTIFHSGTQRDDLFRAAHALVTIRWHRDSDSDGVTTIARRPGAADGTSLAGFTDRELCPHTEGSAVDRPPRVLMLACIKPAHTGGRSQLVDGRDLYNDIARTDPAMLAALSAPRSAYFGEESGYLGAVFQQVTEGRMTVRLRFDEHARFSPMLAPYIDRLRALVRQQAIPVNLGEGHGYILLNDRWLHGRTQFTGQRLMLRIIGDLLPAHEIPGGFFPKPSLRAIGRYQ